MKLVSIASKLFDYSGHFLFAINPVRSQISDVSRRVSRTATLDGGALVVDNGYTASDATFNITPKKLTPELRNGLRRLAQLHSEIIVCIEEGAFLGAISSIDENQDFKIIFLVKTKLSE
jgi:hypothetical protein